MKDQRSGSGKKISNNLVALSSAAILGVYAAGYFRTKSAADRFAAPAAQRRAAGLPGEKAASISSTGSRDGAAAAPRVAPGQGIGTSAAARAARESRTPSPTAVARTPDTPTAEVLRTPPLPAQTEAASISPQPPPPASVNAAPTAADNPPPVTDVAVAQATAPQGSFKDGTFAAWGSCEHGDLEVTVVVENGKLTSARISTCKTLYSCSIIADLPPRVISRQSAQVDFISTATESSVAFSDAVAAALAKAK